MKRTVQPHNLVAQCEQCGTTLASLSERTGIPEAELLGYAAGRLGLNARDRFAILTELAESSPAVTVETVTHYRALQAYKFLIREMADEEREEEARDVFTGDAKNFAQRVRAVHSQS